MSKPKTLVDLENIKSMVDTHTFEISLLSLPTNTAFPVCFESNDGIINILIQKTAHSDRDGSPNLSLRIEGVVAAWGGSAAYHTVTHSRTFGEGVVQRIYGPSKDRRIYVYLKGGYSYQITNYNLENELNTFVVHDEFVGAGDEVIKTEPWESNLPAYANYHGHHLSASITHQTPPTGDVSKRTFKRYKEYTVPLLNGWQQTHSHRPIVLRVYDDGWIMINTYINGGTSAAYTPILELPPEIGECVGHITVYRADTGDSTKMIYPEGRYIKVGDGFENANNILIIGWLKTATWDID